ncbi:hypothetical protein BE11_42185 [Sorangium cellulosum]|nr:hypothetical protein BE11_42185 [Sorangium cellulosum]
MLLLALSMARDRGAQPLRDERLEHALQPSLGEIALDGLVGYVREARPRAREGEPGDPARPARVVVELAGAKNPPLRLPLGTDAIAAIEAKNALVTQELAAWRAVSASTDFPT